VDAGSMRGPRETVAKALALECMRAAKAQERGCFVFAFAGPQEVSSDCPMSVSASVSVCGVTNNNQVLPSLELTRKTILNAFFLRVVAC
jgi:hypothetical protein